MRSCSSIVTSFPFQRLHYSLCVCVLLSWKLNNRAMGRINNDSTANIRQNIFLFACIARACLCRLSVKTKLANIVTSIDIMTFSQLLWLLNANIGLLCSVETAIHEHNSWSWSGVDGMHIFNSIWWIASKAEAHTNVSIN